MYFVTDKIDIVIFESEIIYFYLFCLLEIYGVWLEIAYKKERINVYRK